MKKVPDFWFEPLPWIDNQWQSCAEKIPVTNPATGELLAEVGRADAATVQIAIAGAERAQLAWAAKSAAQRGEILLAIASALRTRKEELGCLLCAEQGKPHAQAVGEVEYAASFFQWFGEQARRTEDRVMPHPEPGREFIVEHRPAGVAGLITPWNFPLAQGAKKIAAALAAGCSAVWKPAELTPLIALALAPIAKAAGLPAGVLQIVPGRGSVVGAILAEHPAVRVLSLTGSTATGSELMRSAAPEIKRLSLELGGNAPFIILPDADLEFVADQLTLLKLFVSGQVCVTANRIFVHADCRATLLQHLEQKIMAAKVGYGLSDDVDAGPLIHAQACADINAMVGNSVSMGARVVCENRSHESCGFNGSFFPPTVLDAVTDEMPVANDEIFGPVLPILTYRTLPEAVLRANQTPYGLAGYVYGNDLSTCRAVASALEIGIIGVNEWRPLKAEIPFGGVKRSGIGVEGGIEGMREFQEIRVISMPQPTLPLA